MKTNNLKKTVDKITAAILLFTAVYFVFRILLTILFNV